MTRIVYSRKARADMGDIWIWIGENKGAETADAIVERIENRIAILEHYPGMGRSEPEIDDHARVLVAERWVVLYAVRNETVHIVRIVDGARDIRRIEWSE